MESEDDKSEAMTIEFEHLEIEEADSPSSLAKELEELDLAEPDEELDLSEAFLEAAAPVEELAFEDSSDDEDLLIADDADQMATKLDLARAYLDMGDQDGARVILEEVAGSGSGEQQQEARELLTRIG
jgi:pilus assembly protein FimV